MMMKPYERRLYLPVILSVICLRERDEWTEIIGKLFPQAFHLTSEEKKFFETRADTHDNYVKWRDRRISYDYR